MIDLERVKVVLWDFDDTLALHTDHRTLNEREYNKNVYKNGVDAWKNCLASPHIKKFMDYCSYLDIVQGLISSTNSFVHMGMKQQWVKTIYGYDLENFCAGSIEGKLDVLYAIKDKYDYAEDEILIVDDFYITLTRAADAGFQACTPMEVVAYCDKIPN